MVTHHHINILDEAGETVKALAPVIVSASRATDIPAFYAREFFDGLDKRYTIWTNPYNGKPSYVSYSQTRFIVFWSKNPEPLLRHLPRLKERGIGFYIQFTLNDYEQEGLEPHVPELAKRIDTFRRIVDEYGLGHAVWRFDPLILTDKIGIEELLNKIRNIGQQLRGYTERLVFSFADIAGYRKVGANLSAVGIRYKEWTERQMLEFARQLAVLNQNELHLRLATCAEPIDLIPLGIDHSRCIDPDLISSLAPDDAALQMWLLGAGKDKASARPAAVSSAKTSATTTPAPTAASTATPTPHHTLHSKTTTQSKQKMHPEERNDLSPRFMDPTWHDGSHLLAEASDCFSVEIAEMARLLS